MEDIEWKLLKDVLWIIKTYGAIGGKLAERNYGLIEVLIEDETVLEIAKVSREELDKYFKGKRETPTDAPDLKGFVFIKRADNQLVKDLKQELDFLKGRMGKAKRYFAKKLPDGNLRLFVYGESKEESQKSEDESEKSKDEFERIKEFFIRKSISVKTGSDVINELLEGNK